MHLTGKNLKIAKDENMTQIESIIVIEASTKAYLVEDSPTPKFSIQQPSQEPLLFNTETKELANRWVTAINSAFTTFPSLSMDQFNILYVVGRGFYGKVMLCQCIRTGELYAIKSIHKNRLIESGKSNTVIAERNIMMKANFPFIVNLRFAFQTPSKFYLGLEYVPGGDLFYHMDNVGVIPLDDTRLYVAEIGLALSYLHSSESYIEI